MTLANESYQVTLLGNISNISAGSHLQSCLLKIKSSASFTCGLVGLLRGRKMHSKWSLRVKGRKDLIAVHS